MSFGIINSLTKPEIINLQYSLEDFKNNNIGNKPSLFVIILGIVNHWVNKFNNRFL